MKQCINGAIAFIALLTLSACQSVSDQWLSSGLQGANATVAYWLNSAEQHRLPPEQLKQLPGAAVYAKLGDNATATMVLSEIEQTPDYTVKRWVTQNEALVTRNGRVIRTQGLTTNRIYTAKQETDPLGCWQQNVNRSKHPCSALWRSFTDVQNNQGRVERMHSAHQLSWQQRTEVTTPLRGAIPTRVLAEKVSLLAHHGNTMTTQHWVNRYWISISDGTVVRSEQQLTPHADDRIVISEARY